MAVSRFRFTQSQAAKPDKHFLNVNPTGAIWDCSNLLAASTEFVAVPWASQGTAAVFRHDQYGKIASNPPLVVGHAGAVIDVTFSPFDDYFLYTAGEDGVIKGWKIPEGGLTENMTNCVVELKGHTKKVGILSYHPSAEGVLASGGADQTVHIWDVERATAGISVKGLNDQLLSVDWNLNGSSICTTTRDKKLSIIDSHTGDVVASVDSHSGSKAQRCIWAKRKDRIVTLGFNDRQSRELKVWDARNLSAYLHMESVDQSSCVMMPIYDEDTSLLYFGSKGDGAIRFFDLGDETVPLIPCSSYNSPEPQKGLCMVPKRVLDTKQCEIARFYRLGQKSMNTIHMYLPRKQADVEFQADVYPPTFSHTPAMTATDFFAGKSVEPKTQSMEIYYGNTSEATPTPSPTSAAAPAVQKPAPVSQPPAATPAPVKPVSPAPAAVPAKQTSQPSSSPSKSAADAAPAKPSVSKLISNFVDPNATEEAAPKPKHTINKEHPPTQTHTSTSNETKSKVQALAAKLDKQREEVNRIRHELAHMEKEMLDTVKEIADAVKEN